MVLETPKSNVIFLKEQKKSSDLNQENFRQNWNPAYKAESLRDMACNEAASREMLKLLQSFADGAEVKDPQDDPQSIAHWALEFLYAAGPDPLARSIEERLIIVAKSSPELMPYVARALKTLEDVFASMSNDDG